MSERPLQIRRRPPRLTPLRRLRFGPAFALAGGAPSGPYPGTAAPPPRSARGGILGSALAVALHAAVVGALLALAANPTVKPEEEVVPVQLLHEIPAPHEEPAPAPKALAERRPLPFAPAAQAVAPQVLNPKVVAEAAPAVAAEKLELDTAGPLVAPREVRRAQVSIDTVDAVTPVAAAAPRALDVPDAVSPALRGPIEKKAAVGPSVGPRAVPGVRGRTAGVAPRSLGAGSSVREGLESARDVLGSPDAPRLASVNTRVGDSYLRGPGGHGTGMGGDATPCFQRPEVQRYWRMLRERVYTRWVLPPNLPPGPVKVKLRFRLDPAGSATQIELLPGGDPALGRSAVEALRSASPFPPMSDRVRCLAGTSIVGTFRKVVVSGSASVVD